MTDVNDAQLGKFARWQHDLFRRVREGSANPEVISRVVSMCLDGKLPDFSGLAEGTHEIVRISILKTLTTVTFPAHDGLNVSKEFKKGANGIGYVSPEFVNWFHGMYVGPEGKRELRVSDLTKNSLDDRILAELGEDKQESTLADVRGFLKKGDKKSWKLFYVRDRKGTLRAVLANWSAFDGGWGVFADPVEHPGEWRDGYQVVSRN
jgi:hypothetical protein